MQSLLCRDGQWLAQFRREGEKIKQQKILQAKEHFIQLKGEHENWIAERNAKIQEAENRIHQKESQLGQQNAELGRKQHELEVAESRVAARVESLEHKEAEYERLTAQVNKQLETIAG